MAGGGIMSELQVYRDPKDVSPAYREFYLKEDVDKLIEDLKAGHYAESCKDGAEIHRLHRCIIRMTRQWLSAIDDMYSRLDDVHGLDDQDVMDWDKVSDLHSKLNKVLEKWK